MTDSHLPSASIDRLERSVRLLDEVRAFLQAGRA